MCLCFHIEVSVLLFNIISLFFCLMYNAQSSYFTFRSIHVTALQIDLPADRIFLDVM
jgi:hypothetical protein